MMGKIYTYTLAIILGIVSSFLAGYLKSDFYRWFGYIIFSITFLLIIVDLYKHYPSIFGIKWRYAATGIIFKDDSVLLIWHPFYKYWLPPGKRVAFQEFPHIAVINAILEETGYEAVCNDLIHYKKQKIDRETEQIPQPFYVAIETEGHRGGIKTHYDFYYVCHITGNQPRAKGVLDYKWFEINKLRELVSEGFLNRDIEIVILQAFTCLKQKIESDINSM